MTFDITEENVEKAIEMLSGTDELHGNLSGHVKYCEEAIKQVKAKLFLQAEGTVAERTEKAIASDLYENAVKEWVAAYKHFKILENQRNTQIRNLDMFQTFSANRRKGML